MIFRFDRFQADDTAFRLLADGVPVPLEPKALRLLLYLLENRGRLVRKQELLNAVWGDAAVGEGALTRSVGLLRKILNDDPREPRFIETVPTAGYRFIAEVDEALPPPEFVPIKAETLNPDIEAATPDPVLLPATPGIVPEPRGFRLRPSFSNVVIILLACFAILASGWWIVSRRRLEPIRSLAVLPLDNLSGDPSQEYFADGMTDALTTELARIPNLRVVSRTSVMAGKGTQRALRDIARQLDVDAIVEGSTVRSGDSIRVTAQLIDARTDRHLWAQSFEGSASDMLTIEDSAAQQIATQARLVLDPPPPRPRVVPAAHDAYLRGRYFFNKQDFRHSLEALQQATALDPSYAPAFAAYASTLDAAATFNIGSPDDLMPKAIAAARHAIELDPQNGEAYTALGSVQTIYEWDWTDAEHNLTRGIALDPKDSVAEFKFAIYLDAVGRAEDAVTHMRRAVQLDPVSFIANRRLGATLYFARHFDQALAQLQRAAEMEQQPATIDKYVSLIYEQQGQQEEAVKHDLSALHHEEPQIDASALLRVYQQQGWQSYWRARTRALAPAATLPCTAYETGLDDLRVKEVDHAFASFEHALDNHCYAMALIRVDPLFDSVRQDARYYALLRRLHQ